MANIDLVKCLARTVRDILEEDEPAVHVAYIAINSLLKELEARPIEDGGCKTYENKFEELEKELDIVIDRLDCVEGKSNVLKSEIEDVRIDANNCYDRAESNALKRDVEALEEKVEELEESISKLEEKFDNYNDCGDDLDDIDLRLTKLEERPAKRKRD